MRNPATTAAKNRPGSWSTGCSHVPQDRRPIQWAAEGVVPVGRPAAEETGNSLPAPYGLGLYSAVRAKALAAGPTKRLSSNDSALRVARRGTRHRGAYLDPTEPRFGGLRSVHADEPPRA